MIITYALLLILVLCSCKVNRQGFNEDFAGKEQANFVKGLFIWFVFIKHCAGYIPNIGDDTSFMVVRRIFGQMVVVPFLFYSGYGVLKSIRNKGKAYVNSMPVRRILVTLANFDVAVVFFILLNLALGIDMTVKQCALSFICWDSVGNSNWYIFAIIICYLATYLSVKVFGYGWKSIISLCVCLAVYVVILRFFKGLYWWYDTIFTYAAGAIYAFREEKINDLFKRKYWQSIAVSAVLLAAFACMPRAWIVGYNLQSVAFMAIILLISMKIRSRNRFLQWSGENLFPLYIYQRLPMLALSTIGGGYLINNQVPIFVVASFLITLFFGWAYRYIRISVK